MNDKSFLDQATVNQLVEDLDADTAASLMRFYVEDATARMARIRDAANSEDWSSLEREVHSLGSASGTQGAIQLMDASRAVEYALREGRQAEAMTDLQVVFELADVSFQAILTAADDISPP